MPKTSRIYSNHTLQALKVFASQIKLARKNHRWSEEELAERAGTSRSTLRRVEKGEPSAEIGLYFEIATLLGIPLFGEDSKSLRTVQKNLDMELALLPKRIDKESKEVFDEF
ncbi:MAG: helix-turn-helix transcriptional regulator [Gammaproteobacteria bacterium]|nr:helix-turn-helix domain-containing protein [Pseudomonadales bacterium]